MEISPPFPATASAEGRQFNGAPSPPTIIVADDHPFDSSLIRWVLDVHDLPYELQVIEHDDYALYVFDLMAQQAHLWSPTIVLLNLNSPQLDNNELLRHIQAIPSGGDIRVVAVISATAPEEWEEIGRASCRERV